MTPIPESNSLGLPVGPWIILSLKVFGFWLHMIFMNLWLIGIPLALVLWNYRQTISKRLFELMPFFMAFGINAGIVPLVFIQTLFAREFYSSTIFQAWFWFMIIPLLCVAYYAVYLASSGYYRLLSGFVSFVLLSWIGLNFSSVMALSAQAEQWNNVFQETAMGGAVSGTYFFLSAEVFCRYGIVVGLALLTTGAFLAFDAQFLSDQETYPEQGRLPVIYLSAVGCIVFAVAGYFYQPYVQGNLSNFWQLLAATIPILAALAGILYGRFSTKSFAGVFFVLQLIALLVNAVARQIVQLTKYGGWSELSALPSRGEWGPVFLFFTTLAIGLAVILWIGRVVTRRIR